MQDEVMDLYLEEEGHLGLWAEQLPDAAAPGPFCCWNSFGTLTSVGTFGSCGSSATTGSTFSSSCG
jgi:hypothetical protein